MNFKKMFKNDLQCSFGCKSEENQIHTFTQCLPLIEKIHITEMLDHNKIFSNIDDQRDIIHIFMKIEQTRLDLREQLLPGEEDDARTPRSKYLAPYSG